MKGLCGATYLLTYALYEFYILLAIFTKVISASTAFIF